MTSRLILAAAASGLLLGAPAFAVAQSAATSMPPAGSTAKPAAAQPTPPVNDTGATTPSSSMPSTSMPSSSMSPSATTSPAPTGSAADTATSAPATAAVKVGANVNSSDGKSIGKISKLIPATGSTGAQVVIDNAGKKTTVLASSLSSDGSNIVWTDNSAATEPK